jgi:hypothetical protein
MEVIGARGVNRTILRHHRLPDGCLAREDLAMRDKSKGVDGKKRRKKKPPELKELKELKKR